MTSRTVGGVPVLVPDLDLDDLDPVTDAPDDDLADSNVEGVAWPELELPGVRFQGSRFVGVEMPDATWRNGGLSRCRLERVDLSGSRLTALTIDRCEFIGCRLTGVHLDGVTLKNVIFEDCRFDYATFVGVRVAGATVWSGGSFTKAVLNGCRLGSAVLTGCRLAEVELAGCDLRGADLRGTDLTGITGLASLAGVVLDEGQLADLAVIAARELDVTVREPR